MKIQVTEKHIRKGIPENCKRCAIALALQDALEGYNPFDVRVVDNFEMQDYDWVGSQITPYGLNDALPPTSPSKIEGGFGFAFRESLSGNVYQWTSYTMSHTDADNVNNFIKEFDLFGYDKEKQESIPCRDVVDVKPFTFELGGEIEKRTVLSENKQ